MLEANERGRRLMWWGMGLFLLGLLTGLIQNNLANPRMGLSAHVEGLMNGTFLIALGAIWSHIRLSPRNVALLFGAALYGTIANWGFTLLAAVFGTSSMTPLAGVGMKAADWQELLVTVGFVSVGVAMLLMAGLALWGLRAKAIA